MVGVICCLAVATFVAASHFLVVPAVADRCSMVQRTPSYGDSCFLSAGSWQLVHWPYVPMEHGLAMARQPWLMVKAGEEILVAHTNAYAVEPDCECHVVWGRRTLTSCEVRAGHPLRKETGNDTFTAAPRAVNLLAAAGVAAGFRSDPGSS